MIKLLFVSGLSGSGKSIALQTLEDDNYYCVDNLPLEFIPLFLDKMSTQSNIEKLAVGIDARSFPEDIHQLEPLFQNIEENPLFEIQLLFLDAADEILLKRYSDTRRKHPLSQRKQRLMDSIQYERQFLQPILHRANVVIDTSTLNIHELRTTIKERLLNNPHNRLFIQVESFGFRNGTPRDADFLFDTRCLTNPHWYKNLSIQTGLDNEVIEFFEASEDVQTYYQDLSAFLEKWIPAFTKGSRTYLSIAIGCTGGIHRSVYISQKLYDQLKESYSISIKHRELSIKQ